MPGSNLCDSTTMLASDTNSIKLSASSVNISCRTTKCAPGSKIDKLINSNSKCILNEMNNASNTSCSKSSSTVTVTQIKDSNLKIKVINSKRTPNMNKKCSSSASSLLPPPPSPFPPPPLPPPSSSSSSSVIVEKEQLNTKSIIVVGTKSSHSVSVSPTIKTEAEDSNQHNSTISRQQKKHKQPQICTSCSSYDVTEINIKLKTCQNCNNVIIDDLDCNNQLLNNGATSSSSTLNNIGSGNCNSNGSQSSYYHQLISITKKLKNAYKSRNISTPTTTTKLSNTITKATVTEEGETSVDHQENKQYKNHLIRTNNDSTLLNYSNSNSKSDKQNVSTTSNRDNLQSGSEINYKNHQYQCLSSNSKSISSGSNNTIVNKVVPISVNNDRNIVKKDVLILRICDLDNKNRQQHQQQEKFKSSTNKNEISLQLLENKSRRKSLSPTTITTTIELNKQNINLKNQQQSLRSLKPSLSLSSSSSNKQQQFRNFQDKIINEKSRSVKSPNNKNDLVSNEFVRTKKNLQKEKLISVVDNKKNRRSNKGGKFEKDNLLSKSLDIIHHSEIHFDGNNLCNDFSMDQTSTPPSYIFTSKSVTNLNENNVESDDDDGPFESINSVELIFISDEFLNKAVKHDLKILKNKKTDTIDMNRNKSLSSSTSSKYKSRSNQQHKENLKIDSNRSSAATANEKESQSLSPISPITPTRGTGGVADQQSSSNAQQKSMQQSVSKNFKKLIVISEDFKRKSLENNIVIVNSDVATFPNSITKTPSPTTPQSLPTTPEVTTIHKNKEKCNVMSPLSPSPIPSDNVVIIKTSSSPTIAKRKNLKQIQSAAAGASTACHQQSSIDDVNNQMTSHAFRSFEEPDEQCLESKEIKTSTKTTD